MDSLPVRNICLLTVRIKRLNDQFYHDIVSILWTTAQTAGGLQHFYDNVIDQYETVVHQLKLWQAARVSLINEKHWTDRSTPGKHTVLILSVHFWDLLQNPEFKCRCYQVHLFICFFIIVQFVFRSGVIPSLLRTISSQFPEKNGCINTIRRRTISLQTVLNFITLTSPCCYFGGLPISFTPRHNSPVTLKGHFTVPYYSVTLTDIDLQEYPFKQQAVGLQCWVSWKKCISGKQLLNYSL